MSRKSEIQSVVAKGLKSYHRPQLRELQLPDVMDSGGITGYSITNEASAGGFEPAKDSGGLFDRFFGSE